MTWRRKLLETTKDKQDDVSNDYRFTHADTEETSRKRLRLRRIGWRVQHLSSEKLAVVWVHGVLRAKGERTRIGHKNSNGTVSRRRRKGAETVCCAAPTCCRLLRENENRETRVWACRMVVAGGSFTGERRNLKLMLCAQGFSVQRNKAAKGTTFFHAGREVGLLRSADANPSVWVFGWRRQRPPDASSNRHQG